MCYSYSNTLKGVTYTTRFKLDKIHAGQIKPYYYVSGFWFAPVPVIANDSPKELQFFSWGLIPRWVRSREDAEKIRRRTLNARGETVFEKPAYRRAALSQRCLIPADGFYEWHTEGKAKYPFYLKIGNKEPFAFAGIWDSWTDKETGEEIKTCSIVTAPADKLIAQVHNLRKRMPVILAPDEERVWLEKNSSKIELKDLLRSRDIKGLMAYPVSKLISQRDANTNVPAAQKPFEYPELREKMAPKTVAKRLQHLVKL